MLAQAGQPAADVDIRLAGALGIANIDDPTTQALAALAVSLHFDNVIGGGQSVGGIQVQDRGVVLRLPMGAEAKSADDLALFAGPLDRKWHLGPSDKTALPDPLEGMRLQGGGGRNNRRSVHVIRQAAAAAGKGVASRTARYCATVLARCR